MGPADMERAIAIPSPEFGSVAHALEPCHPRELYRALREPEDHVHYFEPAFHFATAAVTAADLPQELPAPAAADAYVRALVNAATIDAPPTHYARSWPTRIAREFAPAGLSDGVWLQGLAWVAHVENEIGMSALRQLMIRCGDPGTSESRPERYGALLRSIGVAPGVIARWELEELSPCSDISFEHALLGMALALFPTALRPEIVGFNLWMATVGPCPLLDRLAPELHARGASLTYFDSGDRTKLAELATEMAVLYCQEEGDGTDGARRRMSNGFYAAHESYRRWQLAMSGRNVPITPRQTVVDIVGRKARFAQGHHGRLRLGAHPMEELFAGGRKAHEELVAHLARSRWITPGDPAASPLVTTLISIDGPMFDIFTAAEQDDLREWIAELPAREEASGECEPIPLAGRYTAPQDAAGLARYAVERFRTADYRALLFHLVNADQFPAVRVFGRGLAERAIATVRSALQSDPRLHSQVPPAYSERAVAEIVVDNHARNVEGQAQAMAQDLSSAEASMLLDGCWLQGFVDAIRAGLEECGWLFRIYASEMGDGHLAWNHNYIARRIYESRLGTPPLPATDRRLFDDVRVGVVPVVYMSMALNTHRFLPELLGLNLAIEARGVCGWYIATWKQHVREGDRWAALYNRLHNSIDNYASGHTKWSLAAVQSFLGRVRDAAPSALDEQWQRVWLMWRLLEIQGFGTAGEQQALKEDVGTLARESLVPSVA
jgi:hypothetical protein